MRRWSKRILIVLAVFVLPPVAYYFYASWQAELELRAAITELDAAGEPWRWDDLLAARPRSPEDEQVRSLVLKVCGAMPGTFYGRLFTKKSERRPPNVLLTMEDIEVYAKELAPLRETIAQARTIVRLPTGRFVVIHGAELFASGGDSLATLTRFNLLLQIDANWHAHQGDFDTALEDCYAMQCAGQILQNEPTLMAQMVDSAMQLWALDALERVLAQGQAAPVQLAKLQHAWEQTKTDRRTSASLKGERSFTQRFYDALDAGTISLNEVDTKLKINPSLEHKLSDWQRRANLKQTHARTLRLFTEMVKAAELPEPERSSTLRDVDQRLGKTALFHPNTYLSGAVIDVERVIARIRCAIVALAAERFRREHERWPKTLDELCPKYLAQPLDDPYCRQPLQYRATGDGVVIYSVGPQGNLRGAHRDDAKPSRENGAFEFRLWNLGQRRQVAAE